MNVWYWLHLFLSNLNTVQVKVNEGILEGKIVMNPYGCPFYSFKGIPYAEPPVGELRFQAPQPKTPWEGVWNATEHGPKCFQHKPHIKPTHILGSENCLFLNVYSPNINPANPLPVMVFIHGGKFIFGSGDDDDLGPEFLLRKEVILVTINYRLEILGFLSLDTEDIPGNAGMKDQVAALKWVKKNIQAFGGDPENITLFGNSAGAGSVSFHLVSPMSKGLFKRALLQSGALTCPWALPFRPRDRALALAKKLGCNSTNDNEIYDFFRMQPAENLINKIIPITYVQAIKESPTVYFGVVSESQFGDAERFYYGHPYEVLRNGIHEGLDVMNGYTQDEGVLYCPTVVESEKLFEHGNKYLEFFVPQIINTLTPLAAQMDIGTKFKDYYMKNKTVSRDSLHQLVKYLSMDGMVYGILSLQAIIAKQKDVKSYLYKFTCQSELNYNRNIEGLHELFDYRHTVAHADDIDYVFSRLSKGEVIDMESRTFDMIDQVTTLWTNFAKFGNPTPDDSLGVKWLPYTSENQDYLNIGEQLMSSNFPEKEEMEFWTDIIKEYAPNFFPFL